MKRHQLARLLALAAALEAVTAGSAGAATAAGSPVSGDYHIHAGDQLAISVYGEPTLSQTVTVLPDETIQYPMIGRLLVGGQTPAQASVALDAALGKFLRSPIASIGVVNVGQLTIMVLGNVKTPGKYTLPYNSHVTDAVAAAGGMGPVNGDYPVARVSDTTGVRDASLQNILRNGQTADDVALHDNAIVYIPSPVTFNVEVVGAVDKPGEIPISAGDHLSTAIAKAGNSANSNADLNAIRVTRTGTDGKATVFNVNLYNSLQKGDLSADLVLQKNDVVYVPQSRKGGSAVSNTVFGLLGRFLGF
jgi:polysaccharide export outer membrane protein